MPSEDLDDAKKNKLDPNSFKEELGEDILNGDAGETLEGKEDNDNDDLEL